MHDDTSDASTALIQGRQKVGQFKSQVGMRPHGSVSQRKLARETRTAPAKRVGLPGSALISFFLRKQLRGRRTP
jgi:hypothetical protein